MKIQRLMQLQADLERLVTADSVRHKLHCWIENLKRLQETGQWSPVADVVGLAQDEFPEDPELHAFGERAEDQLARKDEAAKDAELVLEHLRQAEQREATAALQVMYDHDALSAISAAALSAGMIEQASRARLAGQEIDAQVFESEAESLLNNHKDATVLREIRASIRPRAPVPRVSVDRKSRTGSSRTPLFDGSVFHDIEEEERAVESDKPRPAAGQPVAKRSGLLERIFKGSGSEKASNGSRSAQSTLTATADPDAVEWEIGPDGNPRPKR